MPTSLGPAEILVILVVALIVLGPKRLPEAGRQVGKAIAEMRKWSQGFQEEIRSTIDPEASRPSYTQPQPGYSPPTIPMVPAETPPPAENAAGTRPAYTAAQPIPMVPAETPAPAENAASTAGSNGAAATTGSHGPISEPPPGGPPPADPAHREPSGPPADDPPGA